MIKAVVFDIGQTLAYYPIALEDIKDVIDLIDYPFTSNDAGYRKPNSKGLLILSEKMKVSPHEMITRSGI